jgi:hypothetical protein
MKTSSLEREANKRRNANQKSSGKTPGKPKRVSQLSRCLADIPADRGANEVRSTTQGSEKI